MSTKITRTLYRWAKRIGLISISIVEKVSDGDIRQIRNLIQSEAVLGHMLERSDAEIRRKIEEGQVAVCFFQHPHILLGTCSFDVWSSDWIEIGGAAVGRKWRGLGIGTDLIRISSTAAHKAYPKALIFALTDSTQRRFSPKHPFERVGYQRIEKSVHAASMEVVGVWRECSLGNCRHQAEFPHCQCSLMIRRNGKE